MNIAQARTEPGDVRPEGLGRPREPKQPSIC
jgi:hypothetical protein